ncbi:DUF4436 family protein [Streptomyces sp. NPDC101118]|uniref:DUF4436 family protein n=1 Tax=Streptomyces sp. NPDC101118 TaxID=3366109 RepID=UPI00381DDDD5
MRIRGRLPGNRFTVIAVLLAVLVGTGIGLYLNERNTRQQTRELALPAARDWVELDITSQDVDAAAQQLNLYVVPVPHGRFAADPETGAFAREVEITVESAKTTVLRTTPGRAATPLLVQANLYDGTVTDYPFDRYGVQAAFSAKDGARSVPVGLVFGDADAFFLVRPTSGFTDSGTTLMEARVTRTRSTFILAWFMIAAMWALALAVLAGAEVLYRGRQGLVWPSLGWMAATLFALVGMRNAAPGAPPIGSLIDYVAFFWAEAIIAAGLTLTVVAGTRVEHRSRAAAATARAAPADP